MKQHVITLGIVAILLGLAVVPMISSQSISIQSNSHNLQANKESKLVTIIVREYHGDGTYTQQSKRLPINMIQQLQNIKDFEEQLIAFKKRGLLSANASVKQYRSKTHQITKTLGISQHNILATQQKAKLLRHTGFSPVVFNILCETEMVISGFLGIPFGAILSPTCIAPLSLLLATLTDKNIPTADLLVGGMGIGMLFTNGTFGRQAVSAIYAGSLLGFTGVAYHFPPQTFPGTHNWELRGFSVAAFGLGIFGVTDDA